MAVVRLLASSWILGLACIAACGDAVTALQVELVSGNPDPLTLVQRLRLIATGPPPMAPVKTEAARDTKRLELPAIPLGPDRVITVEGLDIEGIVVARGQSDPFDLSADAPHSVRVVFSTCSTMLYRDVDGDGYGDPGLSRTPCDGNLSGYVNRKGDCNDADRDAYPGQTSFFSQPAVGTQSFDFDCDGKQTLEYPDLVSCSKLPPDCTGEGWQSTVPSCGQTETFVPCEKGTCNNDPRTVQRIQGCR